MADVTEDLITDVITSDLINEASSIEPEQEMPVLPPVPEGTTPVSETIPPNEDSSNNQKQEQDEDDGFTDVQRDNNRGLKDKKFSHIGKLKNRTLEARQNHDRLCGASHKQPPPQPRGTQQLWRRC